MPDENPTTPPTHLAQPPAIPDESLYELLPSLVIDGKSVEEVSKESGIAPERIELVLGGFMQCVEGGDEKGLGKVIKQFSDHVKVKFLLQSLKSIKRIGKLRESSLNSLVSLDRMIKQKIDEAAEIMDDELTGNLSVKQIKEMQNLADRNQKMINAATSETAFSKEITNPNIQIGIKNTVTPDPKETEPEIISTDGFIQPPALED